MLALLSEFPDYCPKCGAYIKLDEDQNFRNGESFLCTCGCGMQKTEVDAILEVSEEDGGDLQYMDLSLDIEHDDSEDLVSMIQ